METEYVKLRNALIPEAIAIADAKHPDNNDLWNATFHKTMNRLARERGVINSRGPRSPILFRDFGDIKIKLGVEVKQ